MRNGIIIFFLGCIWQPIFALQPITSFPIPSKVEFAGQTISLDRYDIRERFDREQLFVAYNYSTNILIIKRANRYFPIIEPILKKNGIPDDFKYLAVVESALDPRALSVKQAAGIWQLMPQTAEELGLEVNNEVDERYHIEKATEAACTYFKNAYKKYTNWVTVSASYNAGMGRISGEQENQQEKDFFDLLLNAETSRYIFRILAMKQFLEKPKLFGFALQCEDFYSTIETKEVKVNGPIEDWTVWAQQYEITYLQLNNFNMWIRSRKLTNSNNKGYSIQLPKKSDLKFESSKINIHNPMWVLF